MTHYLIQAILAWLGFLLPKKEQGPRVLIKRAVAFASSLGRFVEKKARADAISTIEKPEGCLAERLGIKSYGFIEISLYSWMTIQQAQILLGEEIKLDKHGNVAFPQSMYVEKRDGLVRIVASPLMTRRALERVIESGLRAVACSLDRVLPWYPDWLIQDEGHRLLVPVLPMGQRRGDIFPKSMTLASWTRAGKDLWGKPTGLDTVARVLVVPAGHGWDGSLHLKGDAAAKLVRGQLEGDPWTIIKGRCLWSKIAQCDPFTGKRLPDEVDGWTTPDQFKGRKPEVGSVVTVRIFPVKEEAHEKCDWAENNRLNLLAVLLGRWDDSTKTRMMADFRAQAAEIAADMEPDQLQKNFTQNMQACVRESEAGVTAALTAKEYLGMATEEELFRLWAGRAAQVKSLKLKHSRYPLVFFTESVAGKAVLPGKPVVNRCLQNWLDVYTEPTGGEFTVVRYPMVCHQSIIRMSAGGVVDGVLDGTECIFCHPEDARFLQGDDDDHLLLFTDYMSGFSGGEAPVQGRGFELDTEDSCLGAFLRGTMAQGSIGYVFNQMVNTIHLMRVLGRPEHMINAETVRIGGLLDILAQGVKKPYHLDGLVLEQYEALADLRAQVKKAKHKHTELLGPVCGNGLHGPEKVDAFKTGVKALFGVQLPGLCKVERKALPVAAMPSEGVASHVAAANSCTTFKEALEWWKAFMAKAEAVCLKCTFREVQADNPGFPVFLATVATVANKTTSEAALRILDGVLLSGLLLTGREEK